MKKIRLFNLTLLLISGLFTGCGSTGLYVTVTQPAEINLKDFDKISVGEIKGSGSGVLSALSDLVRVVGGGETKDSGSHKFSAELTQVLFESKRFEVLDHESLKTGFGQNNRTGNIALISGTISEYNYREDLTHKDVEKKDKKTGEVDTTRTYYREGIAKVSVSLRIVDLRTSKILATRKFDKSESAKESRKNLKPPRIDRSRLFEACRTQIIRSFMRMIVPYTERVYISFETDKKIPELERGFRMVKLGNWDTALDIFQRVTETYPNSPLVHKAYYNLGLSYMYTDQFDQARTALEEAYARKSETKYLNAIKKLNARIKDTRRLEEQM